MIWDAERFDLWTHEREEQLRSLWLTAMTCEEIAIAMGKTSLRAVMSKASRMGLPRREFRCNKKRGDWKWTEAQNEEIRTSWGKLTCREIAEKLGCGITKSGVIGKAHRLGLEKLKKGGPNGMGRPKGSRNRQSRQQRPLRTYNIANGTWRKARPMLKEVLEQTQFRCDFADLNCNTCRWPIGEPGMPDFFFCGAPPEPEKPYCAAHCARAYDNTSRRPVNTYKLMRMA